MYQGTFDGVSDSSGYGGHAFTDMPTCLVGNDGRVNPNLLRTPGSSASRYYESAPIEVKGWGLAGRQKGQRGGPVVERWGGISNYGW